MIVALLAPTTPRPSIKASEAADIILDHLYEPSKADAELHADVCALLAHTARWRFVWLDELDALMERVEALQPAAEALA